MPQIADWIAQSYESLSPPLNASRCVNFFPEIEVQDAKSKTPVPIWGCPGISPFGVTGDGPVKAFNVMNDTLYAVSGTALWKVNSNGTTEDVGTMHVQNQVSIDNNGVEIVVVDGQTGWQYSVNNGASKIVDPNFFAANTVTFFDGYFCFDRVGTKEFFLSPLYGVTPFDGALFASKEATSDLLVATANSHEQLYLFGERRIEVWYDAGNAPPTFPFQRSDGAIVQRGTLSRYSIIVEDNTIFFMGEDGIYYRLEGSIPERVSNHGAETQWAKYATIKDVQALIYTELGHKFLTLTFPSASKTWVLDLSTRRWTERESWLGSSEDSSIGRWRINCAINWFGRTLVGDSQTGAIGQLNFNVFTEFEQPMRGLIVGSPIAGSVTRGYTGGAVVIPDRRRLFMKRFELDMETGATTATGVDTLYETYCSKPIVITTPEETASSTQLSGVGATFSCALFSAWVELVDGPTERGLWLSNQADDTAPGTGGLQVGIFNNSSSSAGHQIVVRAWDASDAAIVSASYALTTWAGWLWIGVSVNTATQVLQVYVNAGLGDQALTPATITWSSTNPISNKSGTPWHLLPSSGP